MGRPRIHNKGLPARVYLSHGSYFFVAGYSGRTKAHERVTLSRFWNAVYVAAQDAPKCLNRHGRGFGYSAPKGGGDALYAKAGDA